MRRLYCEVLSAEARIRPYVRETPLIRTRPLGHSTFLKLENLQVTGSFKARGAFNRLLLLSDQERTRGVLAASTGNHGLAVAHALEVLGLVGTIYLPETTDPGKLARLRQCAAPLHLTGRDGVEAELAARRDAQAYGRVFISPYNDPAIVGGQGTVAVETLRQNQDLDALLVAVGGGGLIGGIAAYAKAARPGIRIIGCSPAASAVMHASVAAGRIVSPPVLPTLADGTAGGIEEDAITFPLCRDLVDDWFVASEPAIRDAMRYLYRKERLVVEGAAAVAVAVLLQNAEYFRQLRVAVVICGGNVDMERFRTVVN